MKTEEILQIVLDINYNILDLDQDNKKEYYQLLLNYISDGCIEYVKFLDVIIWDSDNDERPYINDHEKEDLKTYLLKQIDKKIKSLNEINQILQKGDNT